MDEFSNFCNIILIKTTFENLGNSKKVTNYALNPIFSTVTNVTNFWCKILMSAELKEYLA